MRIAIENFSDSSVAYVGNRLYHTGASYASDYLIAYNKRLFTEKKGTNEKK